MVLNHIQWIGQTQVTEQITEPEQVIEQTQVTELITEPEQVIEQTQVTVKVIELVTESQQVTGHIFYYQREEILLYHSLEPVGINAILKTAQVMVKLSCHCKHLHQFRSTQILQLPILQL